MTIELSAFEEVATGLDHPEGVAWGPDGRVYAGGEAGQVYAFTPGGAVETIATTGGFLFGVTVDGAGDVHACDFGNAELVRVSASGNVERRSNGTGDHPMSVPNFSAFDDDGNLYVTDSGDWGADAGAIFRVAPDGATELWTDAIPAFPNGCCLSEDGRSLLVIESRGRRVLRVPIRDDGSAADPELVVDLPGSQPDGLALASDGSLVVGCYRPDRIYRIAPGGAVEVLAEDPDGVTLNQPTNVAFVGDGLDRLAVSSLGGWSIVAADVGLTGLPLRYPRP